jgi:hypothetical protein
MAVDTCRNALRSKFPDVQPRIEEGPAGIAIRLGVSGARLGEIEAAMTDTLTDIMLSSGVLLMLLP